MTARPLITGATIAVLALALVGCTPDDGPEPNPSPSATESTDAAEEQTPGITDVQDTPGSGEGLTGALVDTTTTTCERGDEGWTVAGTVTNPAEGAVNYRIYVSLLTEDQDTRALQQVNVDGVEPGATADWSASIPLEEDDLSCVLRVERYDA